MAEENEDGQEKTEEPTQRKLEEAAKEGKILTSREMFVFSTTAVGLIFLMTGGFVVPDILKIWGSLFQFDKLGEIQNFGMARVRHAFSLLILTTLVVGIPMIIVVIATQATVGGLNFSMLACNFKPSKINPISGMKKIISVKGLVELGKSILKVVSLVGIAAFVIFYHLPIITNIQSATLGNVLKELISVFPVLIGSMLIALLVIAAIDFAWQKHSHTKSLKMTLKEVKDESKQTEGSPEVKAKIRRMQLQKSAESSRQREALDDVASATTVITNPTHFAVALKYDAGDFGAPKVVAMGKGVIAEQIIERANSAKVRILRIPILARALYFTSDIGMEIAEELYNAVAAILAYVYRIDRGEMVTEPDIELPSEMRFDEYGRREGEG